MNTTTLWLWLLPDAHGHQVFGIGDSTANARADAEENLLAEREDAEEAGDTIAPGAYQVAAGYPCRVEFGVAGTADEGAALVGLAGDWAGVVCMIRSGGRIVAAERFGTLRRMADSRLPRRDPLRLHGSADTVSRI